MARDPNYCIVCDKVMANPCKHHSQEEILAAVDAKKSKKE